MTEPIWMAVARQYLGLAEMPGIRHNLTLIKWLEQLKAWWRDDETPWCGVFVAHCLQTCGYDIPKLWMRAREWASWGRPIMAPVVGCIVVFGRKGGGHVGFVVGKDAEGNLMVLGGNQGNRVSIAPFSPHRVIGYAWPETLPLPQNRPLPVWASSGVLSKDEA